MRAKQHSFLFLRDLPLRLKLRRLQIKYINVRIGSSILNYIIKHLSSAFRTFQHSGPLNLTEILSVGCLSTKGTMY